MIGNKIVKGIVALGLVGVLAGCTQEKPVTEPNTEPRKELELWGYVGNHYNTKLSQGNQPNVLGLSIRLDCTNNRLSCRELNMEYHGETGDYKTIPANLETGRSIPNLDEGDAIKFVLTDGFREAGRLAVGEPLYWVYGTPAKGKLTEYFPSDK